MKWLFAFVSVLGALAISPAAIAAFYDGSVGSNTAKARLDFANGSVTGVLCVAGPGLSLKYDVYTIGGQNPEGRIAGRLLLNGGAVGSIAATKRTTQDEIIWEGTVSLQGASKQLKLSRYPGVSDDPVVVKNGFSFGPQTKDEQGHKPDFLIVTLPTGNFDPAIALLKSIPAVNKIESATASITFISDTILDDCERKLTDVMVLYLTVDAFFLRETYDKLVASKLFSGVTTEAVPLGPESMEISFPQSAIGPEGGPRRDKDRDIERKISNFLDMLVERYFRQLRNTQSACQKHDGSSVFAALRDLPSGSGDGLVIDRLETNKFYFRRFSILGPSRGLVFGLANHWEHYVIELKLYPGYGGGAAGEPEYLMQITLSTGEMAAFQEGSNPPAERFKPISDQHLQTFVQKYSACVSQYVKGSCPVDDGAWDPVRSICRR